MDTNHTLLDYQLTDALEVHFSKKKHILADVKELLLNRPIKQFNLTSLPSFKLEDTLVAIQQRDLGPLNLLYLLNAEKKSVACYRIQLIQEERGFTNGQQVPYSLEPKRLTPA